ncbi:DUF3383 family protein [Kosakonia sacchari]|uniref:DUF3383 family protein n=1 Tax=Kosakonia sacchari TaxID=1158459 RepID=UPI0015855B31|nr:DUF3383 family protein [Kosakonia sacchari]NUL35043.1 DUF3383 family protein [Kosakonia sacchari]
MPNLNRLFSIKINRQAIAAKYGVFGVGMIFAPAPAFYGLAINTYEDATIDQFSQLYRVYTSPDDAIAEGVTGSNLTAIEDYFSQKPAPDQLVVGDISNAFNTLAISLTGVAVENAPATVKAVIGIVNGTDYITASYDGTDWTGSEDVTTIIVADAQKAGNFNVTGRIVYLEGAVIDIAKCVSNVAAVQLAVQKIKDQYPLFFMVMTPSRDFDVQKEIAEWVEAQPDKMGVFIDNYNGAGWPEQQIQNYLFTNNMAGSFSITDNQNDNYLDAAEAGRCLVMAPGSETWALETLNGVKPSVFTESEYQQIAAMNGNTFEDYGSGITVTYPGTTGDGESIEVVRFVYWLADRMQKDLATLFTNRQKIGVDPAGVELVCLQMESSLTAGVEAGGIMRDFRDANNNIVKGFTVTRPTMAQISAVQRINGQIDIPFEFYIRYAIKHVNGIGNALTYGA